MADKKISQLNVAATPLAGDEIFPIVQNGQTVKVDSVNFTAGRPLSALSLTANNTGYATPVVNFQSGDQAGARIVLQNTGVGGQAWQIVAGDVGVSNAGLSLYDATANATRFRIDANGNLIHQVTATAPTLATNSTMSFELTSDTALKIVVRGADGTTRSITLTLA